MSVLVDSDWIMSALKGIPTALDPLNELRRQGLAVSVVTLGEVLEGAYGTPHPDAYAASARSFLSGYRLLNVTDPVVATFARVRAGLRQQGNLIPDLDLLIASTALVHDLTLATGNVRHFGRVPGLRLYRSI